ncbi:DUF2490 domain-containing protein [Chryseolinea lacunae]|uniref:DUF2490 domain-containing protein n=1 Tax=Chryseolinea lacunae TaxID=2801331 RepID=A0ABS1KNX3_9BACT|nr:DUF2490 domain-containing protein [Chryseolinea lacunae]
MVKLISRWICALLLVATTQMCFAQPAGREVVNQSTEWFSVTTNLKVSKRTSFMLEGQFRQVQNLQPMQYQFRTGVEIALNKHFSILPIGYVYTWNYLYGKQPAAFQNNEHRLFEQVSYKHAIGRFNFSHRVRLEQRFIQSHTDQGEGIVVNEGYNIHVSRARYRFMTTVPLNHKKIEANTYFASAYDEAFLSWGGPVTFHEPDQNRIFAGLGYQFKAPLSIQAGFLYQMLIKANGAKQENNLGMQVMLTYNVSLMKAQ